MSEQENRMEIFETYLSSIDGEERRTRLREVLEWIGRRFPELEPRVAWNQPMFTAHGTFIIGFSAAKQHFAVAPEEKGLQAFTGEIKDAGYSQGSQIFRIKWEQPVKLSLLERIIRFNIEDKADCASFWRK